MKTIKILHYTESIHYELEQTAKLLRMLAMQLFEKLDLEISPDEYSALDTISVNVKICQRDLAKLILKDRANTGRILNSLEEKGFIERFVDTKKNRLIKRVELTDAGREELNSVNQKIKTYLEGITGIFSPEEIDEIHMILKKFRLDLENKVEMNI
jgi:DNA-binding MarR family transcriptional regulator